MWLYQRFCLRFCAAEDLLAQRGVTVTYETIRQWWQTCGPGYARTLRRRRGRLGNTWCLDELFVRIQGRQPYLWFFRCPESFRISFVGDVTCCGRLTTARSGRAPSVCGMR